MTASVKMLPWAALLGGLAWGSCRGTPPPTSRERFSREKNVKILEETVRRLASSSDPADREEALWAVHDHRGKVAILAVEGLARSRDPRLLPHLFDRIQDESAPRNLRLACLDALFSFAPSLWKGRLEALLPTLSPEEIRKAASAVLESLPPSSHGSS